jgi:hypothetical protein
MPCFHCHVVIKLSASHSAFMLGTKKTWPNKLKRRLGIPVESRADANRRTAVRAGNARPEAWGKQRPQTVEDWQAWAFRSEQHQWTQKHSMACWSKHPTVVRQIAMLSYYRDHEASKARSRDNARKTYNTRKSDPEWMRKRTEQRRAWDNANREHKRERQREWYHGNKEKAKASRRRYKSKPINRAYSNVRRRVKEVFKGKRSAQSVFGCSRQEFEKHIQSQFTKGMHWNNYGTFWHIDHIVPLSHFDPYNEDHKRLANHWTNLRPLEAMANMRRGNRMKETVQIALPF